ncbi:MAG: asparaginase domain-containing protein [Patescibacteria group bacterium]|nr:asparaginase domain-containing protein [Patescibacteria group bacterium]MDD5715214.1 asparaginase domain-containing protein [Patescibacteria group bacterium]
MLHAKPTICLLFCGGSAMVSDDRVVSVMSSADLKPWMDAIPELQLIADVDPVFVFGGDASEIEPNLWIRLAREIHSRMPRYDGFVVLHGVDTMLYTSAALSFMLQPLGKPIIVTGSPLSAEVTESDKQDLSGLISNYRNLGIKANLINAVQVASMDIAEVAIMFGNRLLQGTRAVKSDAASFNFFDAHRDGLLGTVDFGIKLLATATRRSRAKPRLLDTIESNVGLLQLVPGAGPELLDALLKKGYRGIVVRSFNTNLFPDTFKPVLERAYRKKVPILAHNPFALDVKKKKREYIVINDKTFETTFVKFMWVLGQTRDVGKIRLMMWEEYV